MLQDTVTTAEELQSAIKLSYKSALLRQFYKLLLRVDMLSVPVRYIWRGGYQIVRSRRSLING